MLTGPFHICVRAGLGCDLTFLALVSQDSNQPRPVPNFNILAFHQVPGLLNRLGIIAAGHLFEATDTTVVVNYVCPI
jgi:hypothetical protein